MRFLEQVLFRLLSAIKEAEDIGALRRKAGQIKSEYDHLKKPP